MDAALRKAVWDRARGVCEYCHMSQQLDRVPFEIEHVIPQKHEGPTSIDNLALACFFCNRYKGPNLAGIDPESDQVVALFTPRRENWSEHFSWDGATLRGLTPQARATIGVLRINDPARIALRAALISNSDFPG